MKKNLTLLLGVCLLIAGVVIFGYRSFSASEPLVSSGAFQQAAGSVDYVAFFGLALGGAGALILVFAVWQWFKKP